MRILLIMAALIAAPEAAVLLIFDAQSVSALWWLAVAGALIAAVAGAFSLIVNHISSLE